jgi:formylmethanofuran dehydrogenase subunit E
MRELAEILRESSRRHKHLCPRQVLGARMSLFAGELLGLELARTDKRLLVIAETDGCTVDGIIAATGCHIGGRTLRILDFGKVAATFTDVYTETSIRVSPSCQSRALAFEYTSHARNPWEAMLLGYQGIAAEDLFNFQPVCLNTPLAEIISKPNLKTVCEFCGEEIINGREVLREDLILCRACAGERYYELKTDSRLYIPEKVDY